MRQLTLPAPLEKASYFSLSQLTHLSDGTICTKGWSDNYDQIEDTEEDVDYAFIWAGDKFRSFKGKHPANFTLCEIDKKLVVYQRYGAKPVWYTWPQWKKMPNPLTIEEPRDPDYMEDDGEEWSGDEERDYQQFRRELRKISLPDPTYPQHTASSDRYAVTSMMKFCEERSNGVTFGGVLAGPTRAEEIIGSPMWQKYVEKDDRDEEDCPEPPYFVIYDRACNSLKLMECPAVSRVLQGVNPPGKKKSRSKSNKKSKSITYRTVTTKVAFSKFSIAPDGLTLAASNGREVFVYDLDL